MLVIAGLGIKLASHITHEVKLAICDAEKVFFISFHELMDIYIKKLNSSAESLNYLYQNEKSRQATYLAMKEKVVHAVINQRKKVCFVFYGHPCVFATPGNLAIEELRKKNYPYAVLPGISALDCIFSDLFIDSHLGYACFESTELVMNKRILDTSLYIILWQPALFNNFSTINSLTIKEKIKNFQHLVNYLLKFYSPDQKIIIYSAAMYPGQESIIKKRHLSDISYIDLSIECSLIISPTSKKFSDIDFTGHIT